MRSVRPLLLSVALLGCGAAEAVEDGGAGAPDSSAASQAGILEHTFPAFDVAPGEELWQYCQSWTLRNEQPLYVNRVTASNDGAWHHSNWLFVPQTSFRGPDGTWLCRERGYDEVAAGLTGGVFFAQSTQATHETQQFPPGVAIRIPPYARVLGGVHLLNPTPEARSTAISFEVETIAEDEVHTTLQPLSFNYNALDIAPRSQSRFTMDCDIGATFREQLGRDPEFAIHYVLPHYHALGNYFRLELVGGERDGEVVFETGAAIGDALGATLDPPLDVRGAQAIRMTCGFDNPSDQTIRYGIGDQEMCVVLAFTDGPLRLVGYSEGSSYVGDEGGIRMNQGTCTSYGVREF